MATAFSSLVFKVRRCKPELVAPAKTRPRELKQLSDIDRQTDLHFQMPHLHFYAHRPSMQGRDPVKVIREALAQALLYYYPFAGRLRELPDKKLVVDCTGEGVLFIEADCDATLDQFGDPIHPPFPYFDQLLYNLPGSDGILNCPLLLIQVTRLKCGGFILADRLNHAMSDAHGLVQLLSAIGELARGASTPSAIPVWQREILNARDPPCITCTHEEYVEDDDYDHGNNIQDNILQIEGMVHRSFFVGPKELSNIRAMIPSHLHPCSEFEVLTAFSGKCYASAYQSVNPKEVVRMQFTVNARNKFNPPLPKGYYGNALAMPVAVTTLGELRANPLGYALELIRKAKTKVNQEYMRSLADLMVIKGQPKGVQSYDFSDLTRIGFDQVDYGWGKSVFSGPPQALPDHKPGAGTYYVPFTNKKGESGIMMIVSLLVPVMERFTILFEKILELDPENHSPRQKNMTFPPSSGL